MLLLSKLEEAVSINQLTENEIAKIASFWIYK